MQFLNTLGFFLATVPSIYCLNQSTPSQLLGNGSALYRPLYVLHSNSTPKFHNVSGVTVNPLIKALLGSSNNTGSLQRRDLPIGTCAPGTPCVNGACCSNVRTSFPGEESNLTCIRQESAGTLQMNVEVVHVSQTVMQKQNVDNMASLETTPARLMSAARSLASAVPQM